MTDPTPGIDSCLRCELSATRTRVVRGDGPVPAQVMIVGEAPGETEDSTGKPFQGRSGQLLREVLTANGLPPHSIFITNACRCRPPGNRKPKVREIQSCAMWLSMEIEAVRPALIVLLGDSAVKAVLGRGRGSVVGAQTVDQLRRREDLLFNDVPVVVAYHPAAALRSPRFKSGFYRDIERVAARLGLSVGGGESGRTYREIGVGELERLVPLVDGQILAVDTEFEEDGEPVCVSFSVGEGEAYVVFVDEREQRHHAGLQALLDAASSLVFHSTQADLPALRRLGLAVETSKVQDSCVLAYVLRKPLVGLKALAEAELGMAVVRLDDFRQSGQKIRDLPKSQLVPYACQDPDITRRLYFKLIKEIGLEP